MEYKELTGSEKKFNAILTVLPEQDSTSDLNDAVELLSVVSNYQDAALEFMGFIQVGDGSFNRGGNSNKHPYPCFSAVAFAASLHLERPHIKCRALEFDATTNARFIVDAVLSEFHTSSLFVAAGYDKKQQRRIMQYEPTSGTKVTDRTLKLSENDVVVVTGGAKGITSECAFELAKKYKCKMALVGSSKYNGEAGEISDKLLAYEKEKLVARYYACNISDEAATKAMMDEVVRDMGKVSCIVHGAGKNVPRRAEMVSFDQAMDEISPKLKGAYNLYSAADKKHLKGFVGFTSIIGVTGMAGNSWYAFSNEAVDNFLRNINKQHSIETVSLAYSIWSEVGMGERMGSTDALARMGIGAIHPKLGVAEFMKWFGNKATDQQVVIAATMGNLDTWFRKPYPKPEANRYLENVLSFEKGKTLKARTTLSRQTDIYIEDHDYKGSLLFPTVFGLEAMAQAVAMVMGLEKFNSLKLENISLLKPIVVPENGDTLIEINATVNADGKVKVGISTEHTDFDEEHFSAFFVIGDKGTDMSFIIQVLICRNTFRSIPNLIYIPGSCSRVPGLGRSGKCMRLALKRQLSRPGMLEMIHPTYASRKISNSHYCSEVLC
ncbi:MAG: SDR family NAD(P)-dependent oxidoreductase [Bacteroidetes bacterium]|nr:SDR family NAD(P)-dependent oxidoreductase [Bacteroidota bacterium]